MDPAKCSIRMDVINPSLDINKHVDNKFCDNQRIVGEINNVGKSLFPNRGKCYDPLNNINSQTMIKRKCGALNMYYFLTNSGLGDVETYISKELDKDRNISRKPSYNVEININKKLLYDENKTVVNLSLVQLSPDTRRILGKGLGFVVAPKGIPNESILCSIEEGI